MSKKIQSIDEHGRSKAMERYAKPEPQSEYGHSKMGQNLRGKYVMAEGGGVYRGPIEIDEDAGTVRTPHMSIAPASAPRPKLWRGSEEEFRTNLGYPPYGAIGKKRGGKVGK